MGKSSLESGGITEKFHARRSMTEAHLHYGEVETLYGFVSEMVSSVCSYLLSQKQKLQYLISDPTSRHPVLSDCRTPVRITCGPWVP